MSEPVVSKSAAASEVDPAEPNAENFYQVTRADLPLHCPLPGATLWNSHPRVYLPIEDTGRVKCGYCGAVYTLVDDAR